MQYQIVKNPMSILEVQMGRGERITAESGAMVFMKGNIEIKTKNLKELIDLLGIRAREETSGSGVSVGRFRFGV